MTERKADVLIVGGGVGGVAAALAALKLGRTVVLTEETDWIGGQLTAQAVPPDEHRWIEDAGATASYREFRRRVRDFYRRTYPLTEEARVRPRFDPGLGRVSRLCHEPRAALAVLEDLLAPYRSAGRLTVLLEHRPLDVERLADRVGTVRLRDTRNGGVCSVDAAFVLDATELGDLLDLAGVEHVIGAESRDETGEPHALDGPADPLDQQAVTCVFVIDHLEGEDHTIEKPEQYDFWRSYRAEFWPGPMLGWTVPHYITREPIAPHLFAGPTDTPDTDDRWHYRRILARSNFAPGFMPSDLVCVNWPQNDYWLGPLVGVSDEEKARHLEGARQLSLSLLYWLQTEAPRHDGKGDGYPGLRPRGDVVGTRDGLAKSVYVRESRRVKAEFTILEQHVGVDARPGASRAEFFPDSVGIGSYRLDLHPSTGGRNYIDIASHRFQVPLGALLPVRVENLLPACKNIGTTHVTNGCYRLHPVEWNIGEVAGALAAFSLSEGLVPRQIRADEGRLQEFQALLQTTFGIDLAWPDV